MLGWRRDIVGDVPARRGARVRPTGGGGRIDLFVGGVDGARHRAADRAVGVTEEW